MNNKITEQKGLKYIIYTISNERENPYPKDNRNDKGEAE